MLWASNPICKKQLATETSTNSNGETFLSGQPGAMTTVPLKTSSDENRKTVFFSTDTGSDKNNTSESSSVDDANDV